METRITPEEFEHVSLLLDKSVPGREFLETLGFNPEACELLVTKNVLRIAQEGLPVWTVSPKHWRRVSAPRQ